MSSAEPGSLSQQIDSIRSDFDRLRQQIGRVVVGQQEIVDAALTGLVAGGHVLLDGPPGLGKTLLARTLADALELEFRRIQFTPDLMPADVIGTYLVMESHGRRQFEFQQGPLFANIVLADEINRAIPKTQSALLEGLAENAVTVANETYDLPDPFFVVATQSTDEAEGTFPLPQKQLDRFMLHLRMPFPTDDELAAILRRSTQTETPVAKPVMGAERIVEMSQLIRQATVADDVLRVAVGVVMATHPEHPSASQASRKYVSRGAGPRGAQAMILAAKIRAVLAGRGHVTADDLQQVALPALRHRLVLNFDGHADQVDPDQIIREILQSPAATAA